MDTYNAILLVLIAQYLFIGVVMPLLNHSKITKLEIQTKQLNNNQSVNIFLSYSYAKMLFLNGCWLQSVCLTKFLFEGF